ncbi:MAG: SGNH/GDSL hydrolase family protein, partial [Aureliella sp.]
MIPKNRRRWLLRLLAVALGCLPFLLAEIALRVAGFPPQSPAVDPLVDLHHLRPLFTLSADGRTYSIGPERLNLFKPASFPAEKPPGTFRIFALGGSTTQGEPYSTPTAFPAWMGIDLQAASGRTVEVINCGGLSYASYRVKAILEEVLNYDPDLIVIYSGQNEFLEQRSYAGWREVPLPVARASGALERIRLVQLTRWLVQGNADREQQHIANPTELKAEVDALLDY